VIGRGDQEPALGEIELPFRLEFLFEIDRVLVSVPGIGFEDQPVSVDAEPAQKRRRAFRLAIGLVENARIAPREGHFGVGKAVRQDRPFQEPLARLVESRRLACAADQPVLGPAQNDDAGGCRRLVEIGPGKTILERHGQRIAQRRQSDDQKQNGADGNETPPPARPAGPN